MPPEPKAKLKRRSSRKDIDEFRFDGTHARELELKRNRGQRKASMVASSWNTNDLFVSMSIVAASPGEVSCAECRRLKIKCDKQIPCQSCQRRGCTALCPNGSLSTGQGTRFVLAATEHLHRKIAKLGGRVRQLEDALANLQAKFSTEPHPLLHADLISTNERNGAEEDMDMSEETGAAGSSNSGTGSGANGNAGEVIDAFGTLSISHHGVSRFFGPTGGSESLLLSNVDTPYYDLVAASSPSFSPSHDAAAAHNSSTPDSTRDSRSPASVGDLSLFSSAFPFTPVGQPADIQELIEANHLPSYATALGHCKTYFDQVAWLFRGLTKTQILDDMLPVIYKQRLPDPGEDYSSPHDLSLLFTVFAIGALVGQPDSASGNAQGDHYYQIARAALSLQPVLEKPSIVTVQSLHLMSIFNAMSGSDMRSETSMEMTWSLITLAAHLSQTIGLHRDSERWGLTSKMVQRRRTLFWDLFVADTWQSLNTGRPPTFSLPYVDCSFPQYETPENDTPEKKMDADYELWQFQFASKVVAEVTARTLTAEAPTYITIMELDRKVREFPLPASMMAPNEEGQFVSSFQRCVLDHIRETILLYIHRSFFAQAIIDNPDNPLKSAYAPSFMASYKASSTILKAVIEHFNVWPDSSARFWTMWTFAFTAAVVFGTVVTRGPRSPLAKSAMSELEQACVLFSKASMYSVRAAKALPILKKLNEKAHYALQAAQNDPSGDNGLHWTVKQEDKEDELAIFAGHTRFVSGKKGSSTSSTGPTTPTTTPGTTSTAETGAAKKKKKTTSTQRDESFEASTGMFQATVVPPPAPAHLSLAYRNHTQVPSSYQHPSPIHPPPPSQQHSFVQGRSAGGAGIGPVAIPSHPYARSGSRDSDESETTSMDTSGGESVGSQGVVGGGRQWSASVYGDHIMDPHHHPSQQQGYGYTPEARAPVVLSPHGHHPQLHSQHHSQQHDAQYDWPAGGAGPSGGASDRAGHGHSMPRISRGGLSATPTTAASMFTNYPSQTYAHQNSSSESVELGVSPDGSHVRRVSGGDAYGGGGGASSSSTATYPSGSVHVQHHSSDHHHHQQSHHSHQHPHYQQQTQQAPQYQAMYSAFQRGPPTTNADLADLGIASRDSRLDEKWSMFMSDSGILEPGFRTG